jgi:hypothetical protein
MLSASIVWVATILLLLGAASCTPPSHPAAEVGTEAAPPRIQPKTATPRLETAAAPPPTQDSATPPVQPERAVLRLGWMFWALPRFILGDRFALVFMGEVTAAESRPAETPALCGSVVHVAALRVGRVLHQSDPRDAKSPPPRLRGGELVETDAGAGVVVGDRVLVFAVGYEGSYAIIDKRGTGTPLGIKLTSWSDPIVGATERWLAGTADFRNEADAAPWRPYGEEAIECLLNGIPVGHCGTLPPGADEQNGP